MLRDWSPSRPAQTGGVKGPRPRPVFEDVASILPRRPSSMFVPSSSSASVSASSSNPATAGHSPRSSAVSVGGLTKIAPSPPTGNPASPNGSSSSVGGFGRDARVVNKDAAQHASAARLAPEAVESQDRKFSLRRRLFKAPRAVFTIDTNLSDSGSDQNLSPQLPSSNHAEHAAHASGHVNAPRQESDQYYGENDENDEEFEGDEQEEEEEDCDHDVNIQGQQYIQPKLQHRYSEPQIQNWNEEAFTSRGRYARDDVISSRGDFPLGPDSYARAQNSYRPIQNMFDQSNSALPKHETAMPAPRNLIRSETNTDLLESVQSAPLLGLTATADDFHSHLDSSSADGFAAEDSAGAALDDGGLSEATLRMVRSWGISVSSEVAKTSAPGSSASDAMNSEITSPETKSVGETPAILNSPRNDDLPPNWNAGRPIKRGFLMKRSRYATWKTVHAVLFMSTALQLQLYKSSEDSSPYRILDLTNAEPRVSTTDRRRFKLGSSGELARNGSFEAPGGATDARDWVDAIMIAGGVWQVEQKKVRARQQSPDAERESHPSSEKVEQVQGAASDAVPDVSGGPKHKEFREEEKVSVPAVDLMSTQAAAEKASPAADEDEAGLRVKPQSPAKSEVPVSVGEPNFRKALPPPPLTIDVSMPNPAEKPKEVPSSKAMETGAAAGANASAEPLSPTQAPRIPFQPRPTMVGHPCRVVNSNRNSIVSAPNVVHSSTLPTPEPNGKVRAMVARMSTYSGPSSTSGSFSSASVAEKSAAGEAMSGSVADLKKRLESLNFMVRGGCSNKAGADSAKPMPKAPPLRRSSVPADVSSSSSSVPASASASLPLGRRTFDAPKPALVAQTEIDEVEAKKLVLAIESSAKASTQQGTIQQSTTGDVPRSSDAVKTSQQAAEQDSTPILNAVSVALNADRRDAVQVAADIVSIEKQKNEALEVLNGRIAKLESALDTVAKAEQIDAIMKMFEQQTKMLNQALCKLPPPDSPRVMQQQQATVTVVTTTGVPMDVAAAAASAASASSGWNSLAFDMESHCAKLAADIAHLENVKDILLREIHDLKPEKIDVIGNLIEAPFTQPVGLISEVAGDNV